MNSPSSKIINPSSDPAPEVLVKVENVGKIFCRDLKKSLLYGVKDSARDLVGRRKTGKTSGDRSLRKGEFWANKGISFELRRGECLGLIGHNGAGKTTLLKMLNGLIKPDTGSIEIHGRVGALIALGAGFNPILTGRENVYINGSVLGLKKREVDEIIDDIIDFAEIREFIDAPVQSYSSGMQVRLGFAVASSISPEVLIIDEVLAVGDFRFRQKSIARIKSFLCSGGSAIFVSHNLAQVQTICDKAIYLEKGVVGSIGPVNDVARVYLDKNKLLQASNDDLVEHLNDKGDLAVSVSLIKRTGNNAISGAPCQFRIRIDTNKQINDIILHIVVLTQDQEIRLFSLKHQDENISLQPGQNIINCKMDQCPLLPGKYAVRTNIIRQADNFVLLNKGADDNPDYIEVETSEGGQTTMEEALGELFYVAGDWDQNH